MSADHDTSTRSVEYYDYQLDSTCWFGVTEIDYRLFIEALPWRRLLAHLPDTLRLLDVGCGTGKFPVMLAETLADGPLNWRIDALDPSHVSLQRFARNCAPWFTIGKQFCHHVETFSPATLRHSYDLLWAIHSLYTLTPPVTAQVLQAFHDWLKPRGGIGIIYQGSTAGFYHRFYELYRHTEQPSLSPFMSSEMLTRTLTDLAIPWQETVLAFNHTIATHDTTTRDYYLQQCVFEDRPARHWLHRPVYQAFLETFVEGGDYHFPQRNSAIVFGDIPPVFDPTP